MHRSFHSRHVHARQALGGSRFGFGDDEDDSDSTTNLLDILFPPATTSSTTRTTTTSTQATVRASSTTETRLTTSTTSTTSTLSRATTTSTTTSSATTSTITSQSVTTPTLNVQAEPTSRPQTTIEVVVTASAGASLPQESSGSQVGASSKSNVGAIVGGVAAGILGLAALCAIVAFIVRRMRRKQEDHQVDFDPSAFRRSAVQVRDEPSDPRPSYMTENRNNPPMSFGMMYGAPGPDHRDSAQSQYIDSPSHVSSAMNSADPLFAPAAYTQMYSPQPSPISSMPHVQGFNGGSNPPSPAVQDNFIARRASGNTLATIGESGPSQYASYPAPRPSFNSQIPPSADDYVDLTRSSVSPFQAAQYAAISERLSTTVPVGLDTPAVDKYMDTIPPVPLKDSKSSSASRLSTSSAAASSECMPKRSYDFPVPPSPARTSSSRTRVDSTPPMLPEINMNIGSSRDSYDFPMSIRGGSDEGYAAGDQPSTFSKMGIPPSPLAQTAFVKPIEPPASPVPRPQAANEVASKLTRPETVYDPEDAYGGI